MIVSLIIQEKLVTNMGMNFENNAQLFSSQITFIVVA
jgi:hypothetical protein